MAPNWRNGHLGMKFELGALAETHIRILLPKLLLLLLMNGLDAEEPRKSMFAAKHSLEAADFCRGQSALGTTLNTPSHQTRSASQHVQEPSGGQALDVSAFEAIIPEDQAWSTLSLAQKAFPSDYRWTWGSHKTNFQAASCFA